ncbi:MAG TPA: DUF4129 domain-containing protein [Steroidobacteraceae bacterium]|nr:DUF4129 domain-containing protein [Steroidobacteraceae bacterium]
MRCSVFLLLLSFVPAVWSQTAARDERSPLDVIDSCIDSAPEDATGLTKLEEACPGLTSALDESGYLALLSTGTREQLDTYDLQDLLQVDDWYGDEAAGDLDVARLGPVLDSLRAQEPERPLTWFERFKRWLRSLLERNRSGEENDWLSRLLRGVDIPRAVTSAILYGAIMLIVGLALAVVVNELRVAGIFRKRHGLQDDSVAAGAAVAASESEDLDALSLDRKASLLLRMLVATLVKSGRLKTERSLTHRELCTRAAFDNAEQRESFRRVAALAERSVYGTGAVPAAEVEPIVAAAQALDAQLRGAPV